MANKDGGGLPGDEPTIDALQINNDWRRVWLRAIALSWRDEQFKARLLADARQVLQEELGFKFEKYGLLDERLEIIVADYSEVIAVTLEDKGKQSARSAAKAKKIAAEQGLQFGAGPNDSPSQRKNGWQGFGESLQQTLILRLPPAPKKSTQDGLAIADYDASGRVYPFTLC